MSADTNKKLNQRNRSEIH